MMIRLTALRRLACMLLALLAIALPQGSFAQSTPSVNQFFTVDPNDKSAALLAQVFGPDVWETINGQYSPETMTATGEINNSDQSGVLGAVSLVLNLGCMLLTVIIILWGAISANMSGTLDGHEAGRRYNLFWTPLRSVYSFGLLLPVIGGYSLIQVILMKLMLVSIGIANAGYNIVLDRMFQGKATAPIMQPNVAGSVLNMLQISICQRVLLDENGQSGITGMTNPPPAPVEGSFEKTLLPATGFFSFLGNDGAPGDREFNRTASVSYDGLPSTNFPQGACGSWAIFQRNGGQFSAASATAAADQLYQDRLAAVIRLKAELDPLADQLVAYSQLSPAGSALPSASTYATSPAYTNAVQIYRNATDHFRSSLLDAARRAAATMTRSDVEAAMQGDASQSASEAVREIREGGWLMTGAIYWNLNAINKSIAEVSKTLEPSIVAPNWKALSEQRHVDSQTPDLVLSATSKFLSVVRDDVAYKEANGATTTYLSTQGKINPDPGSLDKIFQAIVEHVPYIGQLDELVMEQLLQDGDFISNMSNIGNVCWNTGWTVLGVALVIDFGTSLIDGFADAAGDAVSGDSGKSGSSSSFVKGAKAIGGVLLGVIKYAAGLLYVIMVPLLLIGFMFAFYLPMIPLILWCINIAGWIIVTVKTFLAGPIWAAAHSIPEGEGIAGQHARQGYTMLLGILLRPILLTIGIIVGGIILQVVGWFLRYILPLMFASFDTTGPSGFFGFVAVLLITATLCTTLTVKCFALSHEIADEILEWIGGRGSQLGDASDSARVQSMAMGVGAMQGANVLGSAAGNSIKRLGEANSRRLAIARQRAGGDDKRSQHSTGP